MATYYYLIASLPSIGKDKNGLSYGRFLDMCRNFVSKKVYDDLCNLSVTGCSVSCGCAIADQFSQYCSSMYALLAQKRNAKLGKNSQVSVSDFCPADCVQAVQKAMEASNPLEAELILMDAQTDYVDSLCSMHFFDEYVLFGYAIKLRIYERRLMFTHDDGNKEFTRLYNGLRDSINSI